MSKFSTLLSACLRAGFCLVLLLSAHASHGQTTKDFSLGYFERISNIYMMKMVFFLFILINWSHIMIQI